MLKLTLLVTCVAAINANNINYDQDNHRDATGFITSRGFINKAYTTETSDGYILTVFRIVNPKWNGNTKRSVLLMHGLTGNADNFLFNTPGHLESNGTYIEDNGIATDCSAVDPNKVGNTIAFVLAACGYDVWLGNQRGTRYSTGHTKYHSQKDKAYWKFNVDDIVKDTIAMIELVKKESKSDTIGYIGHSQGTIQMFQLLSEHKEYNKVIKPFIALAPVAYLGHIATFDKLAALLEPIVEITDGPLLLMPSNKLVKVDSVLANLCNLPIVKNLCEKILFMAMGENRQDTNDIKYNLLINHWPDGTSFKIMAQLAHRANFHTFGKFDYYLGNLAHYGHLTPPKYNLSKITNEHIVLMSGKNDGLADPRDVDRLKRELGVKPMEDYLVPDAKWEHIDFIFADNAGKMVTSKVLSVLNKI